jgi:hypothetical protein
MAEVAAKDHAFPAEYGPENATHVSGSTVLSRQLIRIALTTTVSTKCRPLDRRSLAIVSCQSGFSS